MIEKTAISLIVAFTTLLQDAMSCPRERCVRPDGDVVYYNDLEESIIYDHNYTGSSAEYPVIPIGHDGVITLSECKCQSNFCMRKCCSLNSTMDALTGRCMDDEIVTVNGKRWKKSWFHRDLPCFGTCPAGKKLHIAPLRDGMHFSFISGYLCMDDEHFHMCFNLDQFCIDYVSSPKGSAIASCIKETDKRYHELDFFDRNTAIIHRLVHVTHLISILSLTVTFLVYSCFHELRNIHGKCLLCHLASYIIHYVLLISMNSEDDEGRLATEEICQVLDTADFYFSLAPFSWMNVICFDILMSFRNLRPRHGNSRKTEWKKFSLYSLYSWTTPILAVVTCTVLDLDISLYSFSLFHDTDWCGFSGYVILRCRIYPISVYLGISGVLFVMTAVKIYQINASTSILRREERIQRSEENGNEHSFKIYAKLLVLMGFISWVMEPIHYAASQWTNVDSKDGYYYINTYLFIGFLKDLQGLYLMVFLLWNNKVINLVKEKALKSRAIIIQHCFPQPQTVQPPSLPESSSQVSRSPLRSVVTVTEFPGGQGSLSESGYIVSENRENASDLNVLTGKPVEDTPSPSVWGSSCPSSIPVGDTNLQVSFSTASCSHEITHL